METREVRKCTVLRPEGKCGTGGRGEGIANDPRVRPSVWISTENAVEEATHKKGLSTAAGRYSLPW